MDYEKYSKLMNNGCIYVIGRAKPGHQVCVVFNIKRFFTLIEDVDEMLNHIFFFNEWVINNLLVPGHVESWMTIIDFADVSLSDFPVKRLQELTNMMQRNFRGRMVKSFFINTHWLLQGLWKMLFTWLDEFVQQKITFVNDGETKDVLVKYMDEDIIEQKYGGKRPDITDDFFPPKIY